MPRPLPLTALRAFDAAARLGSFRAAAEELFLTPGAVSHQMRALEDAVGAPLFIRAHRQVRLTEAGRTLAEGTGRAFDILAKAVQTAASSRDRRLRVHAAPSFAAQWLAPHLPGFIAAHPEIEVDLTSSAEASDFARSEVDCDILYLPRNRPAPGLEALMLGEETYAPMCAPALARRIGHAVDLSGQVLIDSVLTAVRWPEWLSLNAVPIPARQGPRFDRSFLAIAAAADGVGVVLDSTRLAAREIAAGRLVHPLAGRTHDPARVVHALAYPTAHAVREPVRLFRQWLVAALAQPSEATNAEARGPTSSAPSPGR